jgi:hypothetical protein
MSVGKKKIRRYRGMRPCSRTSTVKPVRLLFKSSLDESRESIIRCLMMLPWHMSGGFNGKRRELNHKAQGRI